MMGRDDIAVGVGGDGGILPDGTVLPNVGGYLPLIDQDMSTAGDCRYRQLIAIGRGGRLDVNTMYGLRRSFLPQGSRKYSPLQQPTAQQVMIETISAGPTTVILLGSHTNLAIFLMTNPHLKKNIEHIYVMGGGIRSKSTPGCCPSNATATCKPHNCVIFGPGNLFADSTNPYAEFNIFLDPFAAYQVFHSGIPVTLIPLDATDTIPLNKRFFKAFKQQQSTYEAQYISKILDVVRDTWSVDDFFNSYFMWDPFACGVAVSTMNNAHGYDGENEFAEMEYMNITVVTSNKPYGIYDGSNPFFDGHVLPKFYLQKNGIHSGHVQTGLLDQFCHAEESDRGICEDGYTKEVAGPEGTRVLVAMRAKPTLDIHSTLDKEFLRSFLDVLNLPQQSGHFNFTTQFPYYRELHYKPDFMKHKLGKPVVFDMDMSAGDFLALFYLLKVPLELMNLKAIFVNGNGWASAASIDIVYDVLHMMGRDDIPVGLGNLNAFGAPSFSCKYIKAIPHGSGGFLDSDTLFGLARNLPRSPRRYTAENLVKYGARRDTKYPELRQPSALEIWETISQEISPSNKITILTSGPLTNLANIILSDKNASSTIKSVYIVGGHIVDESRDKGNIFTVPSNEYAEFNMFLDPLAAKTVLESKLDIVLIPLNVQRKVTSFKLLLNRFKEAHRTPELVFARRLLSRMYRLKKRRPSYRHMDTFLGEILGAVLLADDAHLVPAMEVKPVAVLAGDITTDGQIQIDKKNGKLVNIIDSLDIDAYYSHVTDLLSKKSQSAVIGSFNEQKRKWSRPANATEGVLKTIGSWNNINSY